MPLLPYLVVRGILRLGLGGPLQTRSFPWRKLIGYVQRDVSGDGCCCQCVSISRLTFLFLTCTLTHALTRTRARTDNTHSHARTRTNHTHTHAHARTHINLMQTYIHLHTNTHARTHACTHIHTHTYTRTGKREGTPGGWVGCVEEGGGVDSLRLPCHPRGPSKEWTAHPNLTESDGSIHLQTVVVPVTVQTALSVQIYGT